ncbi:transketolase [Patescibacteria group bacterium]|nr:transketolase [Patescibacteria group bacterium]MBU1029150.1 transketolase [Patescibacteria group bacterium]MBU1916025.1 transketolase [Patescibacteria group bacterium]
MSQIHDDKVWELNLQAVKIREDVIKMLLAAGSGHPAGSLGMADVFTAMYFHILHHDPKRPDWEDRDRLLLSNGHICPVRYAAMAHVGYFPKEELLTLRKLGSRLQGHPERMCLPGLESTSGPLGAGLSQGAGLAFSARMDGKKWRTYVVTSDGEHGAGLHWEAVLFAGKYRLHNLTNIIDRNNIQIDGTTEEVMPLEPLKEKYEAFNWHVIDIDGNDIRQIIEAVNEAEVITEKPTCIIAHNTPGQGVSFMENDHLWHGRAPNKEEADQALAELEKIATRLKSDRS